MEKHLNENDFIVSKTDTKGIITYVNRIFMEMGEYSEEELLGKSHNIIRHPSMPKAVFKLLWNKIQNKEEIFAFVINQTKNKNDYWVFTNVTPSFDSNGNTIGYLSVRRKPKASALEIIKPLYKEMLSIEKSQGMDASIRFLEQTLNDKGISYDEFITTIQQ
ncbi:PAS domain-containing protein [Sulfurimonas marina]|uniref:PAS domain-containing protein n=1 Tax=Sulfurimonas marina TaxID=2590551 RepID=A0A7M3V926_9BACT|nr:PAS domain-containing protein [Sulfurimonas marina]QOP40259.1 PAS domain-containing protein [Sulfurimonas marina]